MQTDTTKQAVRRHVMRSLDDLDFRPSQSVVDGIVAELIDTYRLWNYEDIAAALLNIDSDDYADILDRHIGDGPAEPTQGELLNLDELGEAMRKMAEAAQQMAAALVEVSQAIRARHGAEEVPPGARLAIDATCPSCRYPERWYDLAREVFGCNWCSYTSILREA